MSTNDSICIELEPAEPVNEIVTVNIQMPNVEKRLA